MKVQKETQRPFQGWAQSSSYAPGGGMQSLIDGSPRMREAGVLAEGIEGACGPLQCYGAREGVVQMANNPQQAQAVMAQALAGAGAQAAPGVPAVGVAQGGGQQVVAAQQGGAVQGGAQQVVVPQQGGAAPAAGAPPLIARILAQLQANPNAANINVAAPNAAANMVPPRDLVLHLTAAQILANPQVEQAIDRDQLANG